MESDTLGGGKEGTESVWLSFSEQSISSDPILDLKQWRFCNSSLVKAVRDCSHNIFFLLGLDKMEFRNQELIPALQGWLQHG